MGATCSLNVTGASGCEVCPADELQAETAKAAEAYLSMPWKAALATRREINGAIFGPQYY